MRVLRAGAFVVVASVLAACASVPSSTPLMLSAHPVTVVLATAIIAPELLIQVVSDAVKASPDSAVIVAAAAMAGAPDQASAIRNAVIQLAPTDAEAVIAITKTKRRTPVVASIRIPEYENIARLVERATR